MRVSERYLQELDSRGYQADPCQQEAVQMLERLAEQVEQFSAWQQRGFARLFSAKPVRPRGIYFWGGVGRGKTFLMDIFFDSVDIKHKKRLHFHRFMQYVHGQLSELKQKKNPLQTVAEVFAQDCGLLCLDEFFVSDIGDAMILANLMDALHANDVAIVTTSNIYPDGLYKDGLQRNRFLPAIAAIKERFDIFNLDAGVDYRLRVLEQAKLFYYPNNDQALSGLKQTFETLVPDIEEVEEGEVLEILGRKISTVRVCEDVVWATFNQLCDGPRSQYDYIEIAKLFHTVVLQDIPQLTEKTEEQARRFINMVDEFYDRGVKLIVSAEVAMNELYQGKRLVFEFERTLSRLLEMQSQEYLAREHLC